jgi:uncharacterized protein YjaZ
VKHKFPYNLQLESPTVIELIVIEGIAESAGSSATPS